MASAVVPQIAAPAVRPALTSRDDALVARIRAEFAEMPGLCLTEAQARRLWNLDESECHRALGRLVAAGYLEAGARGRYLRPSSAA